MYVNWPVGIGNSLINCFKCVQLYTVHTLFIFFVKIERIDTKYIIVATMSKITKEFIKDTLLRIYQETGEIPKSTRKIPEIPLSVISTKFGSWCNALSESGIPLRVNPRQEVKCDTCNIHFMKRASDVKRTKNHFCSHSCADKFKIVPTKDRSKPCLVCGNIFIHRRRKTCGDDCYSINCSKLGRTYGAIGGRASQASQPRRSKGEVLFFTLCSNYFGEYEVLSNAQVFIDKNGNYWDSDIVIPKCRLALCYNGIWHYQQIGKKHNLKQVQSRDLIKKSIISDNGYIQYIIKDTGKFNEEFVYEQFHQFIFRFLIHLELKMK